MKQSILLFEDSGFKNLLPLTYLRPVYYLKCGIFTLQEKIESKFHNAKFILHCREYLKEVVNEQYPNRLINNLKSESIIFINGRLLINDEVVSEIKNLKEECILTCNDEIVAAKLYSDKFNSLKYNEDGILFFDNIDIPRKVINANLIKYPWDLIHRNGEEIVNDFKTISKKNLKKKNIVKFKSVELINRKDIFISKGVVIEPFTILDASDGPIFIDENVRLMSHVSIKGPAFIGKNSIIKMHASIYHNTSIGEVCKVGGEIENSIIHSHSNKQHEGFLGHSYIGSWVNFGAGTTNSDLKNNYGFVDMFINNEKIKTNHQFIGLIMGDHTKTAIGTKFNTGTIVGISCNIFGEGFPPKYIPSFTWGSINKFNVYEIDKAVDVAKIVTGRRNVKFSEKDEQLLRKIFELTAHERNTWE